MSESASNLVQRILASDPTGFDDAIAWYGEDILRLCYFLLHDRQEAEDALQEALLALVRWLREEKFKPQNGSLKSFLLQCARNYCIDRLRKSKRLFWLEDQDETQFKGYRQHPTPFQNLSQVQMEQIFDQALLQLSDQHRVCLVLHELNGESYKQIAETLHISVEAVKKNIYRARKKLRILLAPYQDLL